MPEDECSTKERQMSMKQFWEAYFRRDINMNEGIHFTDWKFQNPTTSKSLAQCEEYSPGGSGPTAGDVRSVKLTAPSCSLWSKNTQTREKSMWRSFRILMEIALCTSKSESTIFLNNTPKKHINKLVTLISKWTTKTYSHRIRNIIARLSLQGLYTLSTKLLIYN